MALCKGNFLCAGVTRIVVEALCHVTTGTVVCHHERRVKVQINFLLESNRFTSS